MAEILDTLNGYIWIVDFATLCIIASLSAKLRQNSSTLMTLGLAVISSGIILQYKELVLSFTDPTIGQIDFLIWCAGFLIFDCLMAFALYDRYKLIRTKRNTIAMGIFIVMASIFVLYVIHMQYKTLWPANGTELYKVWSILAYFIGMALFFTFDMYVIRRMHELTDKKFSFLAKTYLLAFFVVANLQVIMFLEQFVFETRSFFVLYQMSFASVNICTTAASLMVACLALYQHYSKTTREGVLWNL